MRTKPGRRVTHGLLLMVVRFSLLLIVTAVKHLGFDDDVQKVTT